MNKAQAKWYWGIATALLLGAGLRVWLVFGGGQLFTPDESRYEACRRAAGMLSLGRVHEAMGALFESGEHPGFKLLGLIPAFVELGLGRSDRIAALFFGGFSEVSLLLIWLIARRLGLTVAGQFWATFFACASITLFFYSRHIYPYDAALCAGLAGFCLGLDRQAGWKRSAAVGAVSAITFTVYLGYWFLAGAVLCVHWLRQSGGYPRIFARILASLAGFVAVVLLLWLLSQSGSHSAMGSVKDFSNLVYVPTFGSAWIVPWTYLYHAEHVLFFVFVGGFIFAAVTVCRGPGLRDWSSPGLTVGFALILLYSGIWVGSEVLHRTLATGRTDRVLVPFFCLLGGWVMPRVTQKSDRLTWAAAALGVAVVVSSGLQIRYLLQLQFPREFRRRGEELIRALPPLPAGSYYRFVNVDHYDYEVETLSSKPAETLRVADHPYQFIPYLLEGFTVKERALRRSSDQRMKLVRIDAPPHLKVGGESYGRINFDVNFPPKRGGFIEPLLSLGEARFGNIFLVRYLTDTRVQFELEIMGTGVLVGETVTIQPGRTYHVSCFIGGLSPPSDEAPSASMDGRWIETKRRLVWMSLDGQDVLKAFSQPQPVRPDDVFMAVNVFDPGTSSFEFSGDIDHVVRGGLPPQVVAERVARFGAVRISFKGPMSAVGRHEPLVSVGYPGQSVNGFVTLEADGRVSFGVEIWGHGEWHSQPQTLDLSRANEVIYSFGSLYPPIGASAWALVPLAMQTELKDAVNVIVNGHVVVIHRAPTPQFMDKSPEIGVNTAGGSFVSAAFSGEILSSTRLPLGTKFPADEPN